ncbi:MAG: hypothetical protein ACI89L_002712 [Phycisphaerales bacterium]|jgi:hypothetical protein
MADAVGLCPMPDPDSAIPTQPRSCPECGYDTTGLSRCPECGFASDTVVLQSVLREWVVKPESTAAVHETLRRLEVRWKLYLGVPVVMFAGMFAMGLVFLAVGLLFQVLSLEQSWDLSGPMGDVVGWVVLLVFAISALWWYAFSVVDRLRLRLFTLPRELGIPIRPGPVDAARRLLFMVGLVIHAALFVSIIWIDFTNNFVFALSLGTVYAYETFLALGMPVGGRRGTRRVSVAGDLAWGGLGVLAWAAALGFGIYTTLTERDTRADGFGIAVLIAVVGWVWIASRCYERVGTAMRLCETANDNEKTAAPEGAAAQDSD